MARLRQAVLAAIVFLLLLGEGSVVEVHRRMLVDGRQRLFPAPGLPDEDVAVGGPD